jgi:hypothetical protein
MAKYIGTLTSDARGKLGGTIMSRSRAGTTLKGHAVPVNPSTPRQQLIRAQLPAAQNKWRTLSGTDQAGWNLIAAQLTWVNSLGTSFVPTGLQLYSQAYINAALFDTLPPNNPGTTVPTLYPITGTVTSGDGTFLQIDALDPGGGYTRPWAIYSSRPLANNLTYTKTVARKFLRAYTTGPGLIVTSQYLAAFGVLPPAYSYIALRLVGIDGVTFISATPFIQAVQVVP